MEMHPRTDLFTSSQRADQFQFNENQFHIIASADNWRVPKCPLW